MTKSRFVALGLALTILAGGVVGGIAADRLWLRPDVSDARHSRRGGDRVERQLARFRKQLELTDDQAAAIGAILERTRTEIREVRAQSRPAIRTIREQSRADILRLLSPEQAAEYREMIERSRDRRDRRRGRGR